MDPNLLFRVHDDGRVERFMETECVPPGADPTTGVTSKDATIDAETGTSVRIYLPQTDTRPAEGRKKLPVLVYYHGGGFCVGSTASPTYQRFLNSLASKANILVVSVDYRLAPEHKLPAAYDDCWAALKWVFSPQADEWLAAHGDLDHVFHGGDSAGGNIAHQMAVRASGAAKDAEGVKIEGLVLVHPYFWGTEPIGSETRDPIKRGWLEGLWRTVNTAGVEVDDPRLNVTAKAGACSLAGLRCRKVLVAVAERDILAERGRAFWAALKASGWSGEVELFESEGEDHVFHLFKPEGDKVPELMAKLVAFFKI